MIYICTVHHKTTKWIDPQIRYLKKYLKSDFRVFADTPDGKNYKNEFHYVQRIKSGFSGTPDHVAKLKELSRAVLQEASPNDIIIFLDGDAFPIAPLDAYLKTALQEYPLVAIQRKEIGYCRPHPSFCCTTVGFWKSLETTWGSSRFLNNVDNHEIPDTGDDLFEKLESLGIQWRALNRTSHHSLHELWFGIYGHLIYHHGAGFRLPISRFDLMKAGYPRFNHRSCLGFSKTPQYREAAGMSDRVFQMILEDKDFTKTLDSIR